MIGTPPTRSHAVGAAVLIPLIAAGLQWLLWSYIQPFAWFLFYPAVFLAAWLGGRWAGVLAALLSAGLAVYIFSPPMFSFQLDSPATLFSALGFIGMGHLFSYVFERWRQASRRVNGLEQLAASEARYSDLVQHVNSVIIRWRVDGTLFFVNDYAQTLFGYRADELIGRSVNVLLPERESTGGDLSALVSDIAAHPERFENNVNENVCRDGRRLWIAWTNSAVRDAGGQVVEILAVGVDITARKLAEEALRESERQHRLLIQHLHAGVVVHAPDTRIVFANGQAADLLGLTNEQLLGQTAAAPAWHFVREDGTTMPVAEYPVNRVLATREPLRNQTLGIIRAPGNDLCWVLVNAFPEVTAAGDLQQVVVTFVDITARKQAEQRIRYFARLYATLSQVNQTIVRTTDQQQLFDAICQVAVDFGEFRLAWIGLYDAASSQVTPVADYGDSAALLRQVFDLTQEPLRSSTLAVAVLNDRVEVNNNVQLTARSAAWRELAVQLGHQSSAAIPLHRQGQVVGVLNLYAADVNFFAVEEEQKLLAEMGLDISFALDTMQLEAERQQAEAALRESEARSRALIEHAPDGIVLVTPTAFTYASPSALTMFGYSQAELFQYRPDELTHPDDLADVFGALGELLQNPAQVPTLQYRFRHHDGRWCWIESTFSNLLAEPSVQAIVINFRDVTARRQAEADLRQSEEQYRFLVDNTSDFIARFDQTGVMVFASGAAYRFNGYWPEELIHTSAFERIHPDDQDRVRSEMGRVIGGGAEGHVEYRVRRKSGDYIWVEAAGRQVANPAGEPQLIVVQRDITERKRAEAALQQSEARYQQFIAQSFEAIYRTEFDQPIDTSLPIDEQIDLIYAYAYMAECNQATAAMYNLASPADMIGARIIDAHGGRDNPVNRATFKKFIEADYKSLADETMEYTADGQPVWFLSNTVGTVENGHLVRLWGTSLNITDRKRAEAALRDSEQRYRQLFENMSEGFFQAELIEDAAGQAVDFRFVDVNPAHARIIGLRREQVLGKTASDLFPGLEADWYAAISKVVHTGKPFYVEGFVAATGRYYANSYFSPAPGQFASLFSDITERKQAEEANRHQREQLAAVVEIEHALAASLDQTAIYNTLQSGTRRLFPDATTVFVSQFDARLGQISAVYGWHDGQSLDVSSLPAIPLAPPGQGTQSQVIHTRQPLIIDDELEQRLRPGHVTRIGDSAKADTCSALYVPMLVQDTVLGIVHLQSLTPRRFTAEDVRALTLVANMAAAAVQNARLYDLAQREIVERKQRERELAAMVDMSAALRVAATSADIVSVVVDLAQSLLNGTAASVVLDMPDSAEVRIAQASGQWQAQTGLRVPRHHSLTGQVVTTGQPYVTADVRTDARVPAHIALDGSQAVACVPLAEQVGVIGALSVGRGVPFTPGEVRLLQATADIAANALHRASIVENLEQRVMQRTAQLAAVNDRLLDLDRLKSKFVSDVSHELRTPVTSLSLYIDLLEYGKPEKRDRYVTGLKEQMGRLHKLINDILDLSRLERDRDEGGRSEVDLNSIVEHVSAMERGAAETAGLILTCKVADNLPPVIARPDQLTRVITNLVSNAIKYTAAGTVQVRTAAQGQRVCVSVTDTGQGIPADELPHLFERFYRAKAVAQSTIPGTGLGLSIVKEIIESHGGTVEVESELGVGSTFRIWLPGGV